MGELVFTGMLSIPELLCCGGKLLEPEGLGFPPLPPDGLAYDPLSRDTGGSVMIICIGAGVTEKTAFNVGVACLTGELVGEFVIVVVGDGVGGLLFVLHSGDQIALSVQ